MFPCCFTFYSLLYKLAKDFRKLLETFLSYEIEDYGNFIFSEMWEEISFPCPLKHKQGSQF